MPAADHGGGAPQNFWGETPATEEEYYASQGIHATKSFFTSPRGAVLFTRSWMPLPQPDSPPPRAALFMIHGYGNDISWTFQSTPIFLARAGFACFALDLPGHGRSSGLRAFVPNIRDVVDDCIAFFGSEITARPVLRCLPKFLYGESMGGALCLLIHLRLKDIHMDENSWSGAVLVAPMCKIADELRPLWPIPEILTLVARFLPTLPVVPIDDLVVKSVKVEEKRTIALKNPMRYLGKPRLGTVGELLRATGELSRRINEVSLPFLVLHGSDDAVTDPAVSRELYAAARSLDKSIKIYDGAWHSLQFGETDENVDIFRRDVLDWLNQRCRSAAAAAAIASSSSPATV